MVPLSFATMNATIHRLSPDISYILMEPGIVCKLCAFKDDAPAAITLGIWSPKLSSSIIGILPDSIPRCPRLEFQSRSADHLAVMVRPYASLPLYFWVSIELRNCLVSVALILLQRRRWSRAILSRSLWSFLRVCGFVILQHLLQCRSSDRLRQEEIHARLHTFPFV